MSSTKYEYFKVIKVVGPRDINAKTRPQILASLKALDWTPLRIDHQATQIAPVVVLGQATVGCCELNQSGSNEALLHVVTAISGELSPPPGNSPKMQSSPNMLTKVAHHGEV